MPDVDGKLKFPISGSDPIVIERAFRQIQEYLDTIGTARPPTAHAGSHQDTGSDEINVGGLSGELADNQPPKPHDTSHENGGADEINVGGLSGELADNQPPKNHASNHTDGTDDIQNAGAGQKGLLTHQAQTIGGVKTLNANLLPVASIIFQTAGALLDLATNGAYFLPRRLSQEAQPTPAVGELLMWYKPTGARVRLVYNDADKGVVAVQMI